MSIIKLKPRATRQHELRYTLLRLQSCLHEVQTSSKLESVQNHLLMAIYETKEKLREIGDEE